MSSSRTNLKWWQKTIIYTIVRSGWIRSYIIAIFFWDAKCQQGIKNTYCSNKCTVATSYSSVEAWPTLVLILSMLSSPVQPPCHSPLHHSDMYNIKVISSQWQHKNEHLNWRKHQKVILSLAPIQADLITTYWITLNRKMLLLNQLSPNNYPEIT